MTDKTLSDFLTCEQIDFLLGKYHDVHGPWPVSINFWDQKYNRRDTFKCCFYRRLHELSLRSDQWDHYDDFCSTDLDPEI